MSPIDAVNLTTIDKVAGILTDRNIARRCNETRQLDVDHRTPFALGSTNAAPNLRVLCRVHNQLTAEFALGGELMGKFRRAQ